jgi:hypothetical protein
MSAHSNDLYFSKEDKNHRRALQRTVEPNSFHSNDTMKQRLHSKSRRRTVPIVLLTALLLCIGQRPCFALKQRYKFQTVHSHLIAPIGTPYGFLTGGHFELNVYNWKLTDVSETDKAGGIEAGFFTKRFDNEAQFTKYIETVRSNSSLCVFDYEDPQQDDLPLEDDDGFDGGSIESAKNGILLSMNSNSQSVSYDFKPGEEGLYFLMYQICPYKPLLRSTFEVEYHWYNYDSFGNKSYLPAGEMNLPLMFLFFSISYLLCFGIWVINLTKIQKGGRGIFLKDNSTSRPIIYAIHHLMSVLIFLKFLSVFSESIRYHYIRAYGSSDIWSVIYYAVTFVKGTFLFTVILLIGSGWSILRPFLQPRERNVILSVLFLQVINNISLLVLSQEISGEESYDGWTALLHLVDIVCCCLVLIPIVWQVNDLEKSMGLEDGEEVDEEEQEHEPGEKRHILTKLRLFRSFYLLVVAYIYATRILIYLFATVLDYKHIWVRYFVVELVTLTFYVSAGMMFRPLPENVYSSILPEDDKDIARRGETELVDRDV